jgi:hypothetical protein
MEEEEGIPLPQQQWLLYSYKRIKRITRRQQLIIRFYVALRGRSGLRQ